MLRLKSENSIFLGSVLIFVIIVSFLMIGTAGLRIFLGVLILMPLPFYLFLDNFDFSLNEKIFFSFFISITIFPSMVYWLGFVLSFKISIAVAFLLIAMISIIIKKWLKKQYTLKAQG